MKFCDKCDNMYYISINSEDENQLIYSCRYCNYVDENISTEGVCVMNTNLKGGEKVFDHIMNEHTKNDPTLPRLYNKKCPNTECKCEKGIIYIRYDNTNLKYLYLCVDCDTKWKTDDKL